MMRAQSPGGSACARAGAAALVLVLGLLSPSCRRKVEWGQLGEKSGRYYLKSDGSAFSGAAN